MAKYPTEVYYFLRKNCPGHTRAELLEMVNDHFGAGTMNDGQLKSYMCNHMLKTGTKGGYKKGHGLLFPPGSEEYIRSIAAGKSAEEIATAVNNRFDTDLTARQVASFKQRHHISSGLDCRFKPGCTPWTKGKKQSEFMSPESIERSKATRIKKGNHPHNEVPVGTISKTTDGYVIRKISNTGPQRQRWEFMHQAVWEENNGPIPPGHIVIFKDGNKENLKPENLMLVSNRENLELNRSELRFKNPDLTETGLLIAKLNIKAFEAENAKKK